MRPPTIGWAGVRDAGAGCVGAGSPETLHTAATQAGLDFLAAADHDTITQCRYVHAASSPDLVFVRGMEVTTATGEGGRCQWAEMGAVVWGNGSRERSVQLPAPRS